MTENKGKFAVSSSAKISETKIQVKYNTISFFFCKDGKNRKQETNKIKKTKTKK